MTSTVQALEQRARRNPGNPVVTFVVQSTGERTELSAASLRNAAAKIGNALRDEYDLEPGDVVDLRLPLHWQRSAWCAGIWTAGCVLALQPTESALVVVAEDDACLEDDGPQVAVVSLHPFGMPITRPLPQRAHDVTLAVRQQPDAYLFEPTADDALAIVGGAALTARQVRAAALQCAADWQLAAGGRLLLTEQTAHLASWLGLLAVPLAVDASVVLATKVSDLERLASDERISASAAPSP